ncbi:MAG: lipoate--protein ligase [Desulfovibrio sp.]|uniref:lipoate--protein ligase n=1 Tax=Desulfovibrio sp. 7SRBS1 TaxID=3378064 RepID=UPI003B3FE996
MRYIYNVETRPSFNLAAEEWLLHNTDQDVFMLWRNAPAVIVGRNQNTAAEIDEEYVRTNNISVIRRMTGGGAVFHDLGNVNFTFLHLGNTNKGIDFHRFTEPVLGALQGMGVPCAFDGRNDLVIEGKKFSGNAQLIENDRILHHGTLLFAAQMTDMSSALRVNPVKYSDKAVKSIRKRVTNISSHLPKADPSGDVMDVTEFIRRMIQAVSGSRDVEALDLLPEEKEAIRDLEKMKYATWEWNYGQSPTYGFTRSTRTKGGTVEAHLNVSRGIIQEARIYGDFFGERPIDDLAALLHGCPHEREALLRILDGVNVGQYVLGVDAPTLVECLF